MRGAFDDYFVSCAAFVLLLFVPHREHSRAHERSEKVKAVNCASDLSSWTDSHKTGSVPDELVQYEGYTPQFDNATADNVPNPSKLRGGASLSLLLRRKFH